MKHIKTFEDLSPEVLARKISFKYLNEEDSAKLEIFVKDFVQKKNIPDKIKKMRLKDFIDEDFDYRKIFDDFVSSSMYGQKDNLYYAIDKFCEDNKIDSYAYDNFAVRNRNTTFDIITKLYKEHIPQFDNKLIKIFERKPESYKDIFDSYNYELSDVVKDACEWMISGEKYNL